MTDRLARAVDDVRRRWVPDRRLGIFDVEVTAGTISGLTTSRDAQAVLRRLAADAGLAADVRVTPDESVGPNRAAVVTAAIAPLCPEPQVAAARVSEVLHGEPLAVFQRRGDWLRVRAGDGYIAWIHAGYVAAGSDQWLEDWVARATARSLGGELEHEGERRRLPVGARVALRQGGTVETADGRLASLVAGMVRPDAELRAEARLVAAPELARRWFGGAPYLWGGRTDWGCDCSGLVQAVYAARGVALPRDSDQQFTLGEEVPPSNVGAGYHAGDLLFFTEHSRVAHVALWAGGGRIVHASLARGGVASDDLLGDAPRLRRLRDQFVGVRRVEGGRR